MSDEMTNIIDKLKLISKEITNIVSDYEIKLIENKIKYATIHLILNKKCFPYSHIFLNFIRHDIDTQTFYYSIKIISLSTLIYDEIHELKNVAKMVSEFVENNKDIDEIEFQYIDIKKNIIHVPGYSGPNFINSILYNENFPHEKYVDATVKQLYKYIDKQTKNLL